MKKRYIMGMFLTVLGLITAITIVPSLMATENHKKTKIPFAGMTMSYMTTWSQPITSRIVTFYGDPSEPDYIYVRDSIETPKDPSDDHVWQIDIKTRKVVGEEYYSEALFPTNLHIGDEVLGYWGGPVTIIGSQRMSVMGKNVDAWIAYTLTEWGVYYTMYYEKKTGIWLGGNVVWYDGDTLNSWTMSLVNTNVPLFDDYDD